jgi:3-oxoacyl-[acyl-carrier protein] reductase
MLPKGPPNVLVTGGSRGVGLAIACKLATLDYHVIVLARQSSEALAAAMDEAPAGSLDFVACDLSRIEAIADRVRKLKADFGPVYALVNNAAAGTDGLLANMPVAQIEELVRLNTVSPIVLTKYVVRSMMASGTGRIVNIGSIVGAAGYSGLSVYSATKASMIGFTKSLAREVGRTGVTVNAITPGFMDTAMTQSMDAEQREQVVRRSALRRLSEVEDVAEMVAFLIGPGGRNITGAVMTIDAGATA